MNNDYKFYTIAIDYHSGKPLNDMLNISSDALEFEYAEFGEGTSVRGLQYWDTEKSAMKREMYVELAKIGEAVRRIHKLHSERIPA
jgi:hypothetical protein